MTEQELQDALRETLMGLDPEDLEGFGFETELETASTFEETGVLTYNKGLVLRFADGSAFQVTLVQSEQAR